MKVQPPSAFMAAELTAVSEVEECRHWGPEPMESCRLLFLRALGVYQPGVMRCQGAFEVIIVVCVCMCMYTRVCVCVLQV